MEAVITGAIAAIIGLASGQAISVRLSGAKGKDANRIAALEQTVSTMITREEVQSAFLQVAKIEAEKQKAAMMPPPVPSNISSLNKTFEPAPITNIFSSLLHIFKNSIKS